MDRPSAKVLAATVAGAVAAALGALGIWVAPEYSPEVPELVAILGVALLVAVATLVAGYVTPEARVAPRVQAARSRETLPPTTPPKPPTPPSPPAGSGSGRG